MNHLSMRYILVLSLFVNSLAIADEDHSPKRKSSAYHDGLDTLGYFGACAGVILLTSAFLAITADSRNAKDDSKAKMITEYAEARASVQTKQLKLMKKWIKLNVKLYYKSGTKKPKANFLLLRESEKSLNYIRMYNQKLPKQLAAG